MKLDSKMASLPERLFREVWEVSSSERAPATGRPTVRPVGETENEASNSRFILRVQCKTQHAWLLGLRLLWKELH